MDRQKIKFSRFRDKVLGNFDRTSIELEKKARILLYSNLAAMLFMMLLFIVTITLSEIPTWQMNFLLVIELTALLSYLLVILFLAKGKYNFSSQLFIMGNMALGYLSSYIRMDGQMGDLYWAVCVTAIIGLITTLVAVKSVQVLQVPVAGSLVVIYLFAIIPDEGRWITQVDYLLVALVFNAFIGFLCISVYSLTNESIEIAQRESNNNSIKLSQLKMISGQVPGELAKLERTISLFTDRSVHASKEIVTRLNGLDMAIKQIVEDIEAVHQDNPELYAKFQDKQLMLSPDNHLLFDSLKLIKDLNASMMELSLDVKELNRASREYMDHFKEEVDRF